MRPELLQLKEKRNRIETKIQEAFVRSSDNFRRRNPAIDIVPLTRATFWINIGELSENIGNCSVEIK